MPPCPVCRASTRGAAAIAVAAAPAFRILRLIGSIVRGLCHNRCSPHGSTRAGRPAFHQRLREARSPAKDSDMVDRVDGSVLARQPGSQAGKAADRRPNATQARRGPRPTASPITEASRVWDRNHWRLFATHQVGPGRRVDVGHTLPRHDRMDVWNESWSTANGSAHCPIGCERSPIPRRSPSWAPCRTAHRPMSIGPLPQPAPRSSTGGRCLASRRPGCFARSAPHPRARTRVVEIDDA